MSNLSPRQFAATDPGSQAHAAGIKKAQALGGSHKNVEAMKDEHENYIRDRTGHPQRRARGRHGERGWNEPRKFVD